MRLRISVATVAVAALALPASASAGSLTVTVKDDEFDPVVRNVDFVGLPVHWMTSGTTNPHDVTQDKGLFKSGAPSTAFNFTRVPSAGTYPYHCTVHGGRGGVGMSGKLRAPPTLAPAKRGTSVRVLWAGDFSNTGNQFDLQYKVGNGKWKDWKKNTSKRQGVFGQNGKPVSVNPTKTYRIRARSEKSSNPKKKRSGWSPKLTIGGF
jgi:plastocyanin